MVESFWTLYEWATVPGVGTNHPKAAAVRSASGMKLLSMKERIEEEDDRDGEELAAARTTACAGARAIGARRGG
jgi:hypothetical protein